MRVFGNGKLRKNHGRWNTHKHLEHDEVKVIIIDGVYQHCNLVAIAKRLGVIIYVKKYIVDYN